METFAAQKTGANSFGATSQKAAPEPQKASCILGTIIVMSFAVRPIVQAILAPRAALTDAMYKIARVKHWILRLELLTTGLTVIHGI